MTESAHSFRRRIPTSLSSVINSGRSATAAHTEAGLFLYQVESIRTQIPGKQILTAASSSWLCFVNTQHRNKLTGYGGTTSPWRSKSALWQLCEILIRRDEKQWAGRTLAILRALRCKIPPLSPTIYSRLGRKSENPGDFRDFWNPFNWSSDLSGAATV